MFLSLFVMCINIVVCNFLHSPLNVIFYVFKSWAKSIESTWHSYQWWCFKQQQHLLSSSTPAFLCLQKRIGFNWLISTEKISHSSYFVDLTHLGNVGKFLRFRTNIFYLLLGKYLNTFLVLDCKIPKDWFHI